jgi:glycosyltransferase involved in cell wall biosynthesis
VRIVLAQNMLYLPAHGGANRSNRVMLEQLAREGHECHAISPVSGRLRAGDDRTLMESLTERGISARSLGDGSVRYQLAGVEVHAVLPARLPRTVVNLVTEVCPDWVLVPSDDPGQLVLDAALLAAPDRVVYLAHTVQQVPFGPRAFYPSSRGTALVRRSAGVVAVSQVARRHLAEWGEVDSTLLYPAVYGQPPFPRSTGDAVTIVNPCAVKGLPVFLGLTEMFPTQRFLAVPTWGANSTELAALAARPNVQVLGAVDDMDTVWQRTKVLLMPSLWDETFGYSAVEAMLRGVPVLASDVAGLTEAKLGVPYSLPVRPIERYDDKVVAPLPQPIVPEQDLTPWADALSRLLEDHAHHQDLAARSWSAAQAFVASLDERALERYLERLAETVTR